MECVPGLVGWGKKDERMWVAGRRSLLARTVPPFVKDVS